MCDICSEGGTLQSCAACRALTGTGDFPFTRDNYSFDGVFSFVWEHFKREWLMLSVAMLAFVVLLAGVSFVSQIFQAAGGAIDPVVQFVVLVPMQLVQSVVQFILTAGLAVMFWHVFRGESADVSHLFGQFSRFGSFLVAVLIQYAIILGIVVVLAIPVGIGMAVGGEKGAVIAGGIALVLLIVPMFWVALPLTLIPLEIGLGGETNAVQAVKNAFRLADGHRLSLLGYTFVAGLLAIVGVLACCIGVLPASALGQMLIVGLYLALRNGSGLEMRR